MHLRTALVFTLTVSGLALAQPANDTCLNATPIAPTVGSRQSRSAVTVPFGSEVLPEAPMTCAPNARNTVWYSFTPSESGRYEFSTCETEYLETSTANFAMSIYEGPCNALAEVVDGCNNDWCSTRPRAVVQLVAGQTYRVQLALFETAPVAADKIQLGVTRTLGAESCVGPVPDLPLDTTVVVATVDAGVNDSQVGGGAACYSGIGHVTTATTLEASRRDLVLRFTAPRPASYNFRTGASLRAYDTALYLTDSCVAATMPPQLYTPPQCIAASNRLTSTTTAQEEVACVPLVTGQQVYVWVDEGVGQANPGTGGTVTLEATECHPEFEPNDLPTSASGLACNTTGSIQQGGDVDFYALGQTQNGDRVFAMVEAAASASGLLNMRVTTETTMIEYDNNDLDSDYGASAAGVAGTPLTAQPHFLRVAHDTADSGVAQPYHVYSVVQSGTAVPEVEPNDQPAVANAGITNYFSGSTPGNVAPFDVDFYAFQAQAGDLIYLALDSQPARVGNTNSSNHTLALWNTSGQLVFVNDATVVVSNDPPDAGFRSGTPTSPSEHILYRARTSGTYWARVSRTGTVATTPSDYLLSISINCSTGGGFVAPTLASVSPTTGSSLGGELVTLTGTGFGPGSRVTFDGAEAQVTTSSLTELVVRTPVGAEGPADVSVINTGLTPSTLDGGYVFVTPALPPTVTSVSPTEGATAGGQTLTIVGQLFKPGAEVRFDVGGDVRNGTNVSVQNLTRLTVTTPAHVEGAATITVRNPLDALEGSLTDAYRFNAAPVISAVTPASGLISGGTTVTLSGSGFRAGALVRFGTGAGTSVTVDPSGNSLTAVTPATANYGPVDVIVINTDGQQVIRTDGYRYVYPTPVLTAVSPAAGPSAGGTLITLTGTNFFASPTVLVNDAPATTVTRVSATQVTAVTPPGVPGVVSVALANSDGQQASLVAAFAYVAPPTVANVTPSTGAAPGGTLITISGADFQPGAVVRVGGSPAFGAVLSNATTITALTPAGVPGSADVEVINPDTQRGVLAAGFAYEGAPTLVALSPSVGATTGGTVVTLTGSGFVTGAEVLFGALESPAVTFVSSTRVTAVAPAAAMNVVSVSLRNPDGQLASLSSAFRYVEAPTLTAIAPTSGDVRGGTVVRLTGAGFGALTAVRFGAVASPLVTLVNPTTLDAVSPPGAPGSVDVSIANPDGAEVTLPQAFTYTRGAPSISAVAPASGPSTGGTMLTISGGGFAENVTVMVGGVALTDVVVASPELLRGRVPAHDAGMVDVVVTNDDGQSATAGSAYTYVAAANGNQGIADGGNGGLGEAPDAGTAPTMPTGCGCSGVEASAVMLAALGLLLRRRRRSSET